MVLLNCLIMQEILKKKLRAYLVENNPDVLLKLNGDLKISDYINDKVKAVMPKVKVFLNEGQAVSAVEKYCMDLLTADLRPSRFNYLKEVVEVEFPDRYEKFKEAGVLTFEIVNMVEACQLIFDDWNFSEANMNDRLLKHAIIAQVHDYLHT